MDAAATEDYEPFLSALQNMGVEFLHGIENFHQDEVLFVQAVYKFLHTEKMHFMQFFTRIVFRYKDFQKMPIMKNS